MRLIKWAGLVFTSAGVYKIVICTRDGRWWWWIGTKTIKRARGVEWWWWWWWWFMAWVSPAESLNGNLLSK
jgi:hypothetical protein